MLSEYPQSARHAAGVQGMRGPFSMSVADTSGLSPSLSLRFPIVCPLHPYALCSSSPTSLLFFEPPTQVSSSPGSFARAVLSARKALSPGIAKTRPSSIFSRLSEATSSGRPSWITLFIPL